MGSYSPSANWEGQLDLDEFLEEVGMSIWEEALTRCPYLTGNLQRSIFSEVTGSGKDAYLTVWATAHYAIHVELGTKYMAAQPFLRSAMHAVVTRIGGSTS